MKTLDERLDAIDQLEKKLLAMFFFTIIAGYFVGVEFSKYELRGIQMIRNSRSPSRKVRCRRCDGYFRMID